MVAASARLKARKAPSRSRTATKTTAGSLATYRAKRDFSITSEPKAKRGKSQGDRFVVQKHDARRLHYDLRLELDGVLKSWAVTRGPSLVPGEKRLSVHTEDHPLKYIDFEGVIPIGQYGGGTMIVWDQGRWIPEGDPHADYARGRLTFTLEGERLKGRWHLVRTRGKPGDKNEQWLLLKSDDEAARTSEDPDILEEETTSLKS
ncbi:DNA polymerase ligase N-terminal domain-containing protein, partial [Kribbella swartbergensis]